MAAAAAATEVDATPPLPPAPAGCRWVVAPLDGQVTEATDGAVCGDAVREGGALVVLTAMNRFLNEDNGLQMAVLDGNQPDRLCAPMAAARLACPMA